MRWVVGPVVAVLVAALVGQQPVLAAKPRPPRLQAQQVPSVHGTPVASRPRPASLTHGPVGPPPARVVWPAAGSATVDVAAGATARAGGLPVWVGGGLRPGSSGSPSAAGLVSRVRVDVLDRASVPAGWRNGVLLRVGRADGVAQAGRATVSVDYSGFADAFGGGYANRLQLMVLPECALSTVEVAGCGGVVLPSTNDGQAKRVSAEVPLSGSGATVVALTAGASGSSGTFAATSLSPASSWSAGGNSGDFSWQYPIDVPPSLGGPAPQVALSYSSSSVDGRNETTNNQPSWVGEGFDFWPGYIERSYKSCADDRTGGNNTQDTGDECWGTNNAVLSMSGRGGDLIRDDQTGTWRLQDDDNSRIEHLTGGHNGDNDGEYWRLTTTDGTQYYFGLNQLPGYTGTAPADKVTNSVWTMPVAGNNSGEPCHQGSFIDSFCTQAWRWNLDYVVDTHGNTMSLFYQTESNHYARNNTDTDVQSYVRGGWLESIYYGTDNRSATDTVETAAPAPMRLRVETGDRCPTASCGTHDVANWPDTPWDQSCTSTSSCPGLYSPTFWLTRRLKTITTSVWDTTAGVYKDVDQWSLTHTFPPSGDDTRDGLWLASITHTGLATGPAVVGSAVAMPSVSFDWTQLANRVDPGNDHKPPMNWMRLSTIWTETGDKISIRYSDPDCVPGSRMPSSPQNNTLRCYPVREEQPDKSITTEYFHKYLVSSVTEADWLCDPTKTPCSPDVVTSYEYVGAPAWRHADDDGMTKDNLRTWSDFRGYGQVNTRVGQIDGGQQTLSETTFFRGMNGDLDGSGGTRWVSLPALDLNGDGDTGDTADAPAVADDNAYAGTMRQSTVYNGVESQPISTTVNQPWQSAPTAIRDMGDTTVYARHTGTAATWSATKLAAGGWRVTRADTVFDTFGMPSYSDEQGDVAVTGDEKCTTTSYSRNTDANLLDLPAEIDVYAMDCAAQGFPVAQSEADIISMTRTLYDHQAYGAAPTRGEATETEVASAWSKATGATWLVQSTGSYDAYGRVADITDVRGNHTTTAYTPAAGAPVTQTAVTGPLGTTTSTLEPSWGSVTATVDVNGRRTDVTYDALGRTKQVWQPNHTKASFPDQPNSSYDYLIHNSGGTNTVTTNTLNAAGGYTTSIALYDGLLRPRQTQTVSAADGHVGTVFSDTRYDAAGRVYQQSQHFDATVQPSTTLFAILDWQPTSQTVTQYDRAGRVTAQIVNSQGTEKWRTTTSYGGDRVNVVPPEGGTATTTITDALGRTVEVRQYHDPGQVGVDDRSLYDRVTYHYNRKGQKDSWSDNAGNTWTAGFDLLGRQTTAHDPDTGNSQSSYNNQGDLLTVTDGRGQTLAYTYDNLGRKTGEYTPTSDGTKLATWAYDPPGGKGQLASSSRWVGTDEYKITVTSYNPLYEPNNVKYTIPASQPGLAGNYNIGHTYNVDGSPRTYSYPAGGGLGGETITYHYDTTTGLPTSLSSNSPDADHYVSSTQYTAYGELSLVTYDNSNFGYVQRKFHYEDDTHRLDQAQTIRETAPSGVSDTHYTYNPAGDITKITTTTTAGVVDTQCFAYDWAQRLDQAWTPASGDCGQTPSASTLGGPAPYWQSWTFDPVGDRQTQTDHTATGDITATYSYPTAGPEAVRPHTVDHITTTQPDGGSTITSYGYDPAGNTTSRPAPVSGDQTLTWDAEGNLATIAGPGGTSSYIYDADGNRLLSIDPDSTTLYLPGTDLIRNNATGVVSISRYYSWAGQTCAMDSNNNPSHAARLTWLITDQQGTQQTEIDAGTQAVTQRWQTPYGSPRGTNPAWLNNRGFVGGINDPTGLVHEGAREYDPTLGRFISADPLFDDTDPQSWQGYSYADNNPITGSDPTGTYRESQSGENTPAGDPASMGCAWNDTCIPDHPPAAPQPHKKKHHWWDKATNWVAEHKAQIAGFAVGAVVGIGCGAAIGWTGVGAVACGALAGAAGSLTEDLVEGGHSLGGIITDTIVGGVVGGVLGGLGSIAGAAGKAAAGAIKNGVIAAARAGGRAAAKEAGDIAAGRITSGALSGNTIGGLAKNLLGGSCRHSFAPSTPVLMANGTTKPIANIALGDQVQSTDPITGTTSAEPVVALHDNHDTDLTDITVRDGKGRTSVLHTTWHHPFWNDTTHQWTQAADLKPGSQLHSTNGNVEHVVAVRTWTGLHDMRDLTIATTHTYYVLAGDTPVLVHNCGNGGGGIQSTNPSTPQLLQEIATRAERRIGVPGTVAGTNKHTYANTLLTRYQGIFGNRGLETEVSFLNGVRVPYGTRNSVRVDVLDAANGTAYDYKFVLNPPGLSTSRINTILQHVPGINRVLEVNP